MTEEVETTPVAEVSPAEKKVKKTASSATKKAKASPSHPKTSEMVDAAIGTLKERGGSSLLAIKKYLASTYKVDPLKLAPFIKKYLKGAVENGHLIQTKGKGATGSFKLSAKTSAAPKPKVAKKVEKPKTTASKKKTPVEKKKAVKKVASAAKSTTKKVEKKKAEKAKVVAVKKSAVVKAKAIKQPPTASEKTKKTVSVKKAVGKKPAAKKAAKK